MSFLCQMSTLSPVWSLPLSYNCKNQILWLQISILNCGFGHLDTLIYHKDDLYCDKDAHKLIHLLPEV